MALLLSTYSLRTMDRNWDWEDEERLFRAAFRVRVAAPRECSVATLRPCRHPVRPLQAHTALFVCTKLQDVLS